MGLDASYLDAYLEPFGVSCSKGSTSFKGILDMPDQLDLNGDVINADYKLTYKTSAVSLAHNDALTVDGASYKVREKMALDDGSFSQVLLEKQ